MANLPTAHASQTFGRKPVDFYAAPGQVVGSDPRARANERRIQDVDGARHAVRLADKSTPLAPGDLAAVLRVQPGPSRKSRPVAVINYSDRSWTRTEPDAGAVLAKAGVARNMNWVLSVFVLVAAMLVILWPELRAFAVEFFPVTFDMLPGFDVFAAATGALPDLAGWRIEDSFAALIGGLETAVPALSGYGATLVFAAGAALGAIVTFSARSWRLLWLPILIGLIGAGAIGLAGARDAVIPALIALGATTLLFLAGGAINRARDVWRLEQRISRLADHLLRHPPEEMVVPAGAAAHRSGEAMEDEAVTASEEPAGANEDTAAETPSEAEVPAPAGRSATAAAAAAAAQTARSTGALPEQGEYRAANSESESEPEIEAEAEAEAAPEPADADETSAPDSFVSGAEADGPYSPVEPQAAQPGLEQAEAEPAPAAEDPRHSARDISLPPPPPMPKQSEAAGNEHDGQDGGREPESERS